MLILLFKIQSRGVRTQEEDLLSMLNFSSSSCGALQLINTNKHNFVNFLSVYSKDNAFSNSVSSVTFHPLDYFSLFFLVHLSR